ncbi:unnamed protein product [Aphanomyces euteiches]|uniref:Uncharacterized protein n=1 Tax=Aphanomyces euteiches TaxID=100861 RepID=A0A6G0WJF1_9STRA|nr:hypothetical protein Ae201684_014585 [Aphanomyces euteiches]KAH9081045.1 hypothetical protein Ae201684P_012019 [Aphanomyces euteiches]KAH9157282.1 hypothetical protein AeRB84_000870 [Aphanomyces euteiches]
MLSSMQSESSSSLGFLHVAAGLDETSPPVHSDNSSEGSTSPRHHHTKRSTKSKCPPGLRSGKWTVEEEVFTNKMIHFFRLGLLDIEDGTSLRWYLAKKLNCEAMRVTKKLKGNHSIGKQIFRALDLMPETTKSIQKAEQELQLLEEAFVASLSVKPPPTVKSSTTTSTPTTPAKEMQKLGLSDRDQAELLLHFSLTAHRGEKRKLDDPSTDSSSI